MMSHLILPLLVAASFAPSPSCPGTVERLDLAGLTRLADAVVIARVASSRCEAVDAGKFILTFTELNVIAALKGSPTPGQTISVREGGGRIGNLVIELVGAPVYRPGEYVLVFLEKNVGEAWQTISMAQGAFGLKVDRELGVVVATRNAAYSQLTFSENAAIQRDEARRTMFLLDEIAWRVAETVKAAAAKADEEPTSLMPGEAAHPVSGAPGTAGKEDGR